jgi:Skp family chaperone for outer membrane proteins
MKEIYHKCNGNCSKCFACNRKDHWKTKKAVKNDSEVDVDRLIMLTVNHLTHTTKRTFTAAKPEIEYDDSISASGKVLQSEMPLIRKKLGRVTLRSPDTDLDPNLRDAGSDRNHAKFMKAVKTCIHRVHPDRDRNRPTSGVKQNVDIDYDSGAIISILDPKGVVRTIARYAATSEQVRQSKFIKKKVRMTTKMMTDRESNRNGSSENSGDESLDDDLERSDNKSGSKAKSIGLKSSTKKKASSEDTSNQVPFSVSNFIESVKARNKEIEHKLNQEIKELAEQLAQKKKVPNDGFSKENERSLKRDFQLPQITRTQLTVSQEEDEPLRNIRSPSARQMGRRSSNFLGRKGDSKLKVPFGGADKKRYFVDDIDAWSPSVSEDIVFALSKPPKHRGDSDVDLIFQFIVKLPAFAPFLKGDAAESSVMVKRYNAPRSSKNEGSSPSAGNAQKVAMLREICKVANIERFPPGSTIFCQGDVGDRWYVIVRGGVDIFVSPKGVRNTKVKVATLGYGYLR